MRTVHKLIFVSLLALLGTAVFGLIWTSDSRDFLLRVRGHRTQAPNQEPLVDQHPLDTARQLATMATTSDEHQLVADTLRVADHEVDLAFAEALRTAKQNPKSKNVKNRPLEDRVQRAATQVDALQERAKQLTARAASSKGGNQEGLQTQIELAQAELSLAQDELADAKEDLARAGGDAQSKLQRLLDEHKTAEHANVAAPSNLEPSSSREMAFSESSLITQWRDWSALQAKQVQLLQARQESQIAATRLARIHDALGQQVRDERSQKKALAQQAASLLETGKAEAGENTKQVADTALNSLHRLSDDQKDLADLDKRIQDHQELAGIYGEWNSLVESRRWAYLHDLIKSCLWIVLAVFLVFVVERLIDQVFTRLPAERKRLLTLRAVIRFTAQAAGVLAILFITFGSPSQMSTILGLAGAGLTVALKDFIVAFFGWFILMGPNGIRVGDWVEINGVGGRVIEIGLLRTVLLETGDWTYSGHPTGRQVSFVNSFAVEGHYFNFSTSGQWLWDELQVLVPWEKDPYPMIEEIRAIVAKASEGNVQRAEQEWQRVTRRYGMSSFSAEPAINVKATSQGVEVIVRYITRANERYEMRSRLSHAIVDLFHGKKGVVSAGEARPALATGGANITP